MYSTTNALPFLLLVISTKNALLDTSRCLYPRGLMNGQCVECPVDTLYEYIELITYQKYGYWSYRSVDSSYHKCVKICSQKRPIVTSRRFCSAQCQGKIMQNRKIKYCEDDNINNGFCKIDQCQSSKMKCFYMQCFENCPEFTVHYNNSCVIKCFEDQPYIFLNECVTECPKNHVLENRVCQNSCSIGRYLFNRTCVKNCPLHEKYIHENECVPECPPQMLIEENVCVNKCSEIYALDGQMCVKKCPNDLYEHEKECLKVCPNNTLTENQKCVNKCSSGLLQMKFSCVAVCPLGHFINESAKVCEEQCNGVQYYHNKISSCLQECPEGTVEISSICVKNCPSNKPFIYLKKCHSKCPTSSIFISKREESDFTLKYFCVQRCTKYISSFSNVCVDACSSNEVLYKNKCQASCPLSDPYRVRLPVTSSTTELNLTTSFNYTEPIHAIDICAIECPSTFVIENSTCYVKCPYSERQMIFNSSCLQKCPDKYPLVTSNDGRNICTDNCQMFQFKNTCVNKCPETHATVQDHKCVNCSELGQFENGKTCVNNCDIVRFENRCYSTCPPNVKYVYNGTCVEACPIDAAMVMEQHYGLYNLEVCMEKCPKDKFIFDNHCVSTCPNNKRLPINGECFACTDVGKFDDGSKCVDVCQYLHYDMRCVGTCPHDYKIFNATCVIKCPLEVPYDAHIYNFDLRKSEHRCVATCEYDYLHKNSCVTFCPRNTYIFNGTCVERCPMAAPFISHLYKDSYFSDLECLSQCKQSYYSLNVTCVRTCPDGYLKYQQKCLRSCPTESPYIYNKACVPVCKDIRQGMNCFDKCPKGMLNFDKTCVQTCPSIKPYIYKESCVENCPYYLMLRTCYEQCPSGLVGHKKTCLLKCPSEAKYRYRWECLPKCPNNTITDSMLLSCSDSCQKGKYKLGQSCSDECPSHAPYILNEECVDVCNDVLDGLHCNKQCPDGKFVYDRKCFESCPKEARFQNKKRCMQTCPFVHDDHNRCIEECPKNLNPHGKSCKPGCPPDSPFQGRRQKGCVKQCDNDYEFSGEDYKCISKIDCSSFIDGTWCRQTCLEDSYALHSKDNRYCKSLVPVYLMICFLSFIGLVNIIFVIQVVCHCYNPRLGEKRNIFELKVIDDGEEPIKSTQETAL
uniref:Proprotein convertase subtilisin/kexin type 5-like n=1 Tax=Crassostrea virginica TaxID=6565 RepID=A0A8B8BCA3_CRAVI|nr:proprotein convertase subtilisin/kexin type 5-like [Crassostrea virginica]